MTPVSPPDEQLLRDFLQGHEAAYELLVMRHRLEMMRAASAILKHREDAEDVVQQALLKAYERAHQYRGEAPVRIWLRRLLVSACLDQLRRRKVRAFLCPWEDSLADRHVVEGESPTDGPARMADLRQRLDRILRGLPARQRTIFALRILEEWSLNEIAASLQVDVGTVKTHLFRAVRRVRAELEGQDLRGLRTAFPVPAALPESMP